jgi:hypothetical protein
VGPPEPLDQPLHPQKVVAASDAHEPRRLTKGPGIAAIAATLLLCLHASPASAQDATPPHPPSAVTSPEAPQDELENGGLGAEWVYLNADLGAAYTDLVSLRSSNWQIVDNTASGPAFGFGAGVRLAFFSAGVRVRDLQMSSFNMWETDLETAFHFRIWRIDGAFGVRGGYAFLGQFSPAALVAAASTTASNVVVHGWNVGPNLDLDFYVSKLVSIGVDGNAEFLFLERPPIALPAGATVSPAFASLYQDSGSSAGVGLLAMTHVGVHF